jgi:crossover junction endodeoxyribonuclease RuvC
MLILGIDPGLSGALCFYDPTHKQILKIYDMPLVTKTLKWPLNAKKPKSTIDAQALLALLKPMAEQLHCAVVERVSAAPGQGTVSMFRFGEGFGLLQGLLAALGVRTHLVRPNVWKPAMGLSGDKSVPLARVRDLFPKEAESLFHLKKHDGRAEATLLALYGTRQFFHPIYELY